MIFIEELTANTLRRMPEDEKNGMPFGMPRLTIPGPFSERARGGLLFSSRKIPE